MKDNKIVNIAGLLLVTALAFFIVFQVKDYVDVQANAIEGVSKGAVEEAMDVTGQEIVKAAVKYVNKEGVAEAFKVTVAPEGFHGPIELEVIFEADGLTVKSVSVLSQTETPNFGDQITKEDVLAKFVGAKSPLEGLDLISGATVTSEAAKYGVNMGSAFIQQAEFGITVEVEEPDAAAGATH